jgi:hypothetical protein
MILFLPGAGLVTLLPIEAGLVTHLPIEAGLLKLL